jgi:outer membrane protein assembly factor BamB
VRRFGFLRVVMVAASLSFVAVATTSCDKDKDVEPPKVLVPFKAKLAIERVWTAALGGKDRRLRLALAPAADGQRVYAAGAEGTIAAFDATSGRTMWRVVQKLPLSAGPAVGSGTVLVGTNDGQLLALDAETGLRRWQIRVSGEVLSAPAISGDMAVLVTIDGRAHGIALATGKEVWTNDQSVPHLSVRGTARPIIVGDMVVCGFDNGKVAAYGVNSGEILWETAVSPVKGRTELERLVDVDGAMAVSGRDLFVVGFQGRIAQISLDSGQVWWAKDASSYRGLSMAGDTLFMTAADSRISGLQRRDGSQLWQQEALARRGVTAPVVDGGAVVVADFEGQVHWLDQVSGEVIGRIATTKARITNAPVAAGGMVYVQNDAGQLYALRARERG